MLSILSYKKGYKPFGGCTTFGCGAAFNFLAVLSDGEVHACRKLPSPIGNIFRQSITEIYDSSQAEQYRAGCTECHTNKCKSKATCTFQQFFILPGVDKQVNYVYHETLFAAELGYGKFRGTLQMLLSRIPFGIEVFFIRLYFSVQLPDKPFNIFFVQNSQNYSAIAFNHIEHPVLVHPEPVII